MKGEEGREIRLRVLKIKNRRNEQSFIYALQFKFKLKKIIPKKFRVPPECILNGGTVPSGCILNGGAVPPGCILNGGTVPPGCILNGGTVPPFNLFLLDMRVF